MIRIVICFALTLSGVNASSLIRNVGKASCRAALQFRTISVPSTPCNAKALFTGPQLVSKRFEEHPTPYTELVLNENDKVWVIESIKAQTPSTIISFTMKKRGLYNHAGTVQLTVSGYYGDSILEISAEKTLRDVADIVGGMLWSEPTKPLYEADKALTPDLNEVDESALSHIAGKD